LTGQRLLEQGIAGIFGKVKCLEKRSIKDIARAVVEQGLAGTEYELVDVQFKSERGQWFLNIFVDKPGGITLNDCELVNKLIDPILDAEPEIAGKHDYLTVSSPGLDRPIKTDCDFKRNMGRTLDVKLFSPVNKKRELTGNLQAFDEENVFLEIQGNAGLFAIKRANIAKAVQHIEF
jgi:ribosome maturation factor RimP